MREAVTGDREQVRLVAVPLSLDAANEFVRQHHRHHAPVIGHKFSIGATDEDGGLRGADGTLNACSVLYAAAWRAARAMGYTRIGTYILADEPGTSLKAAGWKCLYETPGRSWSTPSRPRDDKHPLGARTLWEATA